MKILFAPMQGFTDSTFFILMSKYFGYVDSYFLPYIKTATKFKKNAFLDLKYLSKTKLNVVPQIMSKDFKAASELSKVLYNEYGYNEVNWNIGCPYPMVTNRGLGSALLSSPNKIDEFLDGFLSSVKLHVSVKMRLGLNNYDEAFGVVDVLNKYDLKEVIIHPRRAVDKYFGSVNLSVFLDVIEFLNLPVVYNGDIKTIEDYNRLKNYFSNISSFMIGRGLIADPMLAAKIKGQENHNFEVLFPEFYNSFVDGLFEKYNDKGVVICKIRAFWKNYWSINSSPIFEFITKKKFKRIIKAKNIADLYIK